MTECSFFPMSPTASLIKHSVTELTAQDLFLWDDEADKCAFPSAALADDETTAAEAVDSLQMTKTALKCSRQRKPTGNSSCGLLPPQRTKSACSTGSGRSSKSASSRGAESSSDERDVPAAPDVCYGSPRRKASRSLYVTPRTPATPLHGGKQLVCPETPSTCCSTPGSSVSGTPASRMSSTTSGNTSSTRKPSIRLKVRRSNKLNGTGQIVPERTQSLQSSQQRQLVGRTLSGDNVYSSAQDDAQGQPHNNNNVVPLSTSKTGQSMKSLRSGMRHSSKPAADLEMTLPSAAAADFSQSDSFDPFHDSHDLTDLINTSSESFEEMVGNNHNHHDNRNDKAAFKSPYHDSGESFGVGSLPFCGQDSATALTSVTGGEYNASMSLNNDNLFWGSHDSTFFSINETTEAVDTTTLSKTFASTPGVCNSPCKMKMLPLNRSSTSLNNKSVSSLSKPATKGRRLASGGSPSDKNNTSSNSEWQKKSNKVITISMYLEGDPGPQDDGEEEDEGEDKKSTKSGSGSGKTSEERKKKSARSSSSSDRVRKSQHCSEKEKLDSAAAARRSSHTSKISKSSSRGGSQRHPSPSKRGSRTASPSKRTASPSKSRQQRQALHSCPLSKMLEEKARKIASSSFDDNNAQGDTVSAASRARRGRCSSSRHIPTTTSDGTDLAAAALAPTTNNNAGCDSTSVARPPTPPKAKFQGVLPPASTHSSAAAHHSKEMQQQQRRDSHSPRRSSRKQLPSPQRRRRTSKVQHEDDDYHHGHKKNSDAPQRTVEDDDDADAEEEDDVDKFCEAANQHFTTMFAPFETVDDNEAAIEEEGEEVQQQQPNNNNASFNFAQRQPYFQQEEDEFPSEDLLERDSWSDDDNVPTMEKSRLDLFETNMEDLNVFEDSFSDLAFSKGGAHF